MQIVLVLHDPQKNSKHPVQNLQPVKPMWPVIINATCQTNATNLSNQCTQKHRMRDIVQGLSDVVLNLHDAYIKYCRPQGHTCNSVEQQTNG